MTSQEKISLAGWSAFAATVGAFAVAGGIGLFQIAVGMVRLLAMVLR